jgi:hypothetical protein
MTVDYTERRNKVYKTTLTILTKKDGTALLNTTKKLETVD